MSSNCRSAEKVDEVDMDEMMAAMVLTSLSFSPLLHSPKETPAGKLRVMAVVVIVSVPAPVKY